MPTVYIPGSLANRRAQEEAETTGIAAPIVFGYARIPAVPVFRAILENQKITTGVSTLDPSGNSAVNRDRFGEWFDNTQSREANYLLLQQYVIGTGEFTAGEQSIFRELYTVFINGESLGYDGWFLLGSTNNKWQNCAHHYGGAGRTLAGVYSTNRSSTDAFKDLATITGLYKGKSNFDSQLPSIDVFLYGLRNQTITADALAADDDTDTNAAGHLLTYLTSAIFGLTVDDLDIVAWTDALNACADDADLIQNTARIRERSYALDAPPKNANLDFPIPEVVRYQASGIIPSDMLPSRVIAEFIKVMPSAILWNAIDSGKLSLDVRPFGADNPTTHLITDDDLVNPPSVITGRAIPNEVIIEYSGYEQDFSRVTVTKSRNLGLVDYATSGTYQFVVPAGITELNFEIIGAQGGDGGAGGQWSVLVLPDDGIHTCVPMAVWEA